MIQNLFFSIHFISIPIHFWNLLYYGYQLPTNAISQSHLTSTTTVEPSDYGTTNQAAPSKNSPVWCNQDRCPLKQVCTPWPLMPPGHDSSQARLIRRFAFIRRMRRLHKRPILWRSIEVGYRRVMVVVGLMVDLVFDRIRIV